MPAGFLRDALLLSLSSVILGNVQGAAYDLTQLLILGDTSSIVSLLRYSAPLSDHLSPKSQTCVFTLTNLEFQALPGAISFPANTVKAASQLQSFTFLGVGAPQLWKCSVGLNPMAPIFSPNDSSLISTSPFFQHQGLYNLVVSDSLKGTSTGIPSHYFQNLLIYLFISV